MNRHLVTVGGVLGAIILAIPAHAANCANRDIVVERLQSRYDESFAAGGLQSTSSSQTLVEVWASAETGTFTVMLTTAEGLSCVVATGTDWHQQALVKDPEETDS